jgi:hypothetical protein
MFNAGLLLNHHQPLPLDAVRQINFSSMSDFRSHLTIPIVCLHCFSLKHFSLPLIQPSIASILLLIPAYRK